MTFGIESALAVSVGMSAVAGGEYFLRRYLPHSSLHYPWIPNSRVKFTLDLEQYPGFTPAGQFNISPIGERGSTIAPRRSRRPFRVLVMGGSAAECPQLSDEHFWPLVMQEEIRKSNVLQRLGYSSIHVGSIGRSLSPIQLQKEVLNVIASRYAGIDFVVTFFGASDLVQWMEQECNLTQFKKSLNPSTFFRANCFPPYRLHPAQSAFGKLAKQTTRRLISQSVSNLSMGANLKKLRERRKSATEMLHRAPNVDEFLSFCRESFSEFIASLSHIAKNVLVIEQPWMCREIRPEEESMMWHFSFGDPRKSACGAYFDHSFADDILRRISQIQREVALSSNVSFLSMIDKVDPSTDNYTDYIHHTPIGSSLIGKIAAKYFCENMK